MQTLITAAISGPLRAADIEHAATVLGLTVPDLYDAFAEEVRKSYLDGTRSWSDSDMAMNHLFAYASGAGAPFLSDYAMSVYLAFDAGEYRRPPDRVGFDPTSRRRRLLERVVPRKDITS